MDEKENGLLIYISENFKYNSNIAIFSFYKTLIKQNIEHTKELHENVIKTLDNINSHGSIVIIDNFKESIDNIKKKVNNLILLLDHIPLIFIASLKKNKYKKPCTNMFEKLKFLYDKEICLEKSIVVGANAGRSATNKLFKDDSDIDKAFAANININFCTPEQLFYKDNTPRSWQWRSNIIENILQLQKHIKEPEFNLFLEDNSIILISGPPCSGKTLLANRIKNYYNEDASIIDVNNFDNRLIMKQYIQNYTHESKNIIIVDTMENENIRELYFAHSIQKKIILIEIDTYRKVCEFLNKFKLQIAKSPKIEEYSTFVFNKYYNSYKSFSLEELNPNIKNEKIKYIKYPLVLRTRKEIFYHF